MKTITTTIKKICKFVVEQAKFNAKMDEYLSNGVKINLEALTWL